MRFALPLLLVGLLAGCAHVDYVGESYAPTSRVDVFYSEENVPRAYTVIGEVVATGDALVSTGKMQEKIRKEAMKNGADAVVLTSLEKYTAGEHSSWSENETQSKDKKGRIHNNTSGSSSTTKEEKKKIRAIFIRYKPSR
jgi:nucleotide-binding universal stress UspA family protein